MGAPVETKAADAIDGWKARVSPSVYVFGGLLGGDAALRSAERFGPERRGKPSGNKTRLFLLPLATSHEPLAASDTQRRQSLPMFTFAASWIPRPASTSRAGPARPWRRWSALGTQWCLSGGHDSFQALPPKQKTTTAATAAART